MITLGEKGEVIDLTPPSWRSCYQDEWMGREGWVLSLGDCLSVHLESTGTKSRGKERRCTESKSKVYVSGGQQGQGEPTFQPWMEEKGVKICIVEFVGILTNFLWSFPKCLSHKRLINDVAALSYTEIPQMPLFYIIPSPVTINPHPPNPSKTTQHLDNFL